MTAVTLLTDFGTADGYVGEMKGVLLTGGAETLVDVSHAVEQGDVRAGAWALHRIWSRFPPGTVHLAVVDPGVGGDRRAVAARADGRWFVGPDNGLLTWVAREHEVRSVVELDADRTGLEPLSDTFHGRDLFAPAAARLASGGAPGDLGRDLAPGSLRAFELGRPRRSPSGSVRGEVWHVDRFGNVVTNVPSDAVSAESAVVRVGGEEVRGVRTSYAAVEPGEIVLTRGSMGTLEVSVRNGSAARRLSVEAGDPVEATSGRRAGGD